MKTSLFSGLGANQPGSEWETAEINTQMMTKAHAQDPLRAFVDTSWHQLGFFLMQVLEQQDFSIKQNGPQILLWSR